MGELESIEDVLAEHDWRWAIRDSVTGDGVRIACTADGCDWAAERVSPDYDVWVAYNTHLADAIRAHLAEVAGREGATHGLNHAPLPDGVYLDPGFCEGCDTERAGASLSAQLDEAIAKWEAKGPTSLTVALLAEAAYGARAYLQAIGDQQ